MLPVDLKIKIYSDTICPWCYIGLKTLETSMTLYQRTYPSASKDTFSLAFSSYYLNRLAPTTSTLASTRLIEKNGSDRATGIRKRLERVGRAHGINFTFAGKVGNTRDSHRLMYLAGLKGEEVQMGVAKELFRGHFEGEMDVSAKNELVDAALDAGMERVEVREWLDSERGGEEVDREAEEAREKGVNSVPTFEVNGKRVEGAEDAMAFYEVFRTIKEESV